MRAHQLVPSTWNAVGTGRHPQRMIHVDLGKHRHANKFVTGLECVKKLISRRILTVMKELQKTSLHITSSFLSTNRMKLDQRRVENKSTHCRLVPLFLVLLRVLLVDGGWIDSDTPLDKYTTLSLIDGSEYNLVMSDEFNRPGRSFADGDDPAWTALDKSDDDSNAAGGGSLHFYNSSMVTTTKDGMLEIRSIIDNTEWDHSDEKTKKTSHVKKFFKSGMLQSWNKFCFTGGIVEVDVIFPGDPFIGGLWPAVWILGNLGRATYEGSTNNLWPWSFNKCDRKMQNAQTISACNAQNHYGLNPYQGRGSTEIDIIEVMSGFDEKPLSGTGPPISFPFATLTLQVAPGVPENRPSPGYPPRMFDTVSFNGHTQLLAQTWYDGLEFQGDTSINPFFYGTYLGETRPEEPVTRRKDQAFQADAIGAMTQLSPDHYKKPHTFRLEWQPGPGGRIDWFTKQKSPEDGEDEWIHAYSIRDETLSSLMESQIPAEPSYLILNVGISSTWGFPFDVPAWCPKCYDCTNSSCTCSFFPGFCNMMKKTRVAMYVDHIRIYQSRNDTAHVGLPHTTGCDPVEYPTREFILGHQSRYMRPMPFAQGDKGSLKDIRNGGGLCDTDSDCGTVNSTTLNEGKSRGMCIASSRRSGILGIGKEKEIRVCKCNKGYTGPYCLADDHREDTIGAYELRRSQGLFFSVPAPQIPFFLVAVLGSLIAALWIVMIHHFTMMKEERKMLMRKYVGQSVI